MLSSDNRLSLLGVPGISPPVHCPGLPLPLCSDADLAHGIIARVHDESHVNRFWASFPPARVLTAAYMYPEVRSLHCSRCLSARHHVCQLPPFLLLYPEMPARQQCVRMS